MAIREFYIGTSGPFEYDDADTISNPTSGLHGESYQALLSEGQMKILTAPVDNEEVIRLNELDGRIFASTEVANIDDPSAELNTLSSVVGSILWVYETIVGGPDEWTQYVYDDAIGAENPPYTVDGSIAGEGWVAVGGKYSNINSVFDHIVVNEFVYWGNPNTDGSYRLGPVGGGFKLQKRLSGTWHDLFSFD